MATSTLADRLRAARSRTFVGRTAEITLFRESLRADPAPFSLLWLHGPGGIGKSALLHRLADEAHAAGLASVLIDAAGIDPTPEGLGQAVRGCVPDGGRLVLLIDTAERLAPIEGWLRHEFLPGLPGDSLIVLAGRRPPDSRWRSDLGWSAYLRAVALRDLDPADAEDYLVRRGIPAGDLAAVLRRTRGHPLALALVSDVWQQREPRQRAGTGLAADHLQDVVSALLERFLDDVPDQTHRRALQVLGHARVTTAGLLRATVDPDRAQECFDWLCGLSFVELGGEGVAPHELARDVLDDDLRWRDREAWLDLHGQVRGYYLARIVGRTGADQARATADLLWFHRDSPALSAYTSWDAAFSLWSGPAQPADLPAILDLVAEHEGAESVALHRAWWDTQPEAFQVVRSESDPVHGFFVQLRLPAPTSGLAPDSECAPDGAAGLDGTAGLDGGVAPDGEALAGQVGDPIALAAWRLVADAAPLRPGEHVRVLRSWIGRDGYHQPSPTHQMLTGVTTRTWVTEPGLAVSVAYAVDPRLWTPMFAYVDYARAVAGDVRLAGHAFAAYLHDWRVTPPLAWLELMATREHTGLGGGPGRDSVAPAERHLRPRPLLVLSRSDFTAAVRDAFRAANRPSDLAGNPLMRSRLVGLATSGSPGAGHGSPGAGHEVLRELLVAEVAALRRDGRRELAARVLELTYLSPVRTQEAAAARLSLPFSTYRRHLAAGLAAVTEALWARELHGPGG